MIPKFFPTPKDFRKWFEKNHKKEKELLVGFYKISSGKKSITWSESVDEALSYGWIDGVRNSFNEESYTIRFTPRKPKSIWSNVNIKKVEDLTKKGLMQPAGIAAFAKREEAKSGIYSFENEEKKLDAESEKKFRKNKKAFAFFQTLPPSYKKTAIHWVMTAKQEKTKQSRLETIITDSEAERKSKQWDYGKK